MILRRYYPKGYKGRTYSDEYLQKLRERGVDTSLVDTAKVELILTRKEQEEMFRRACRMVLERTRWVLDNLNYLLEFKVNWENYHQNQLKKPKNI